VDADVPAARSPTITTTTTGTPVRPAGSSAWWGVAYATLAALLFGINGTVSKTVLESGLSSLRLVELRSVGAAVCLLVAVMLTRPRSMRAEPRELAFLFAAGVVGIGLVQWFYFVAIARLPVGIALLLEYLAPVLVVVWVRFVRHEQVRARLWAALALSVAGLVVVAQAWQGLRLDGIGVLAGFAAAASLAAYYLTSEKGLGTRDPLSLAAWTFTAAAVLWSVLQPWWTFPWDALTRPVPLPGPLPEVDMPAGLLVLWVVVLGTVVPYGLILAALRTLGSARTGLLGMAEPVLAGMVAWVVLGEALSAVQLAGAAVVLTGIVLAETARTRPPEAAGLPQGVAP
jgi:drug/metabolite transporter (DMT)-like permease